MTLAYDTSGKVPPGPAGDQELRRMRAAPLEFITAMAAEYGDIARHRANGEYVYMLNRPDLARHVLMVNGTNYTKDRTPDDVMLRPLLGNGLLTSNGPEWERQRKICAPAFRPREVATFDGVITRAAGRLVDRWRPAAEAGDPVRVDDDLAKLTLTVIAEFMLGTDVGGFGEGFGRAVDAVNRFIGHYLAGGDSVTPADIAALEDTARLHVGFQRARTFLDGVVRMIIAARRVTGGGDLLGAMAAHGRAMTDTDLRDQVLTIIMAGHETTAQALTWTLYLLDRHPAYAGAVHDEVDRVLGDRPPTAADLPDLEACRRAIQEAMRIYPPVWLIFRRALEADAIEGYRVPAGTLVCVSPYVIHRDPRYWGYPAAYEPDRFAPEAVATHQSHQYLPFGGGPRICVGRHFAMAEAVLVLAVLAQHLRLELRAGFPVEPEALATLRPRHGMVMTPRRRR